MLLKKIKNNKLYSFLLLHFIKNFYDFFWHNILNFNGRLLYFSWLILNKKKNSFDLKKNDKKIIKNNFYLSNISNEIYSYCKENLLEKSKEELLNINSKSGNNPTNSGINTYSQDIFERIPINLQKKIFELAHSDLIISTALSYLKVFPIIDKILLYHNIPKNIKEPRGAMLWHKDDFGYKSMDIFIAITDIDESNGPLTCVEKKNKLGILYKNKHENISTNNISKGERGKIKFDYYENNYEKTLKLIGEKGTALFIDSFTVYHRGGYCLSNDRLMLRISYQTPDSVRVSKEKREYLEQFHKCKFKYNYFLKHLYFHRPSNFIVFIRNYLMKFYRILHTNYTS